MAVHCYAFYLNHSLYNLCFLIKQLVIICFSADKIFSSFVKDYPLVLSSEVLSKKVPYLGGSAEMNFYVEGLRFPDKDFDGLITINLSLLQPVKAVRSAK